METVVDFSMWALFMRATFTVKAVMLILCAASIWSWAIILNKYILLRRVRAQDSQFDATFWSGTPLEALYTQIGSNPKGAAQSVFSAGMAEWYKSHNQEGVMIAGAQTRIERSMNVALSKQADKLQYGLSALASIGSVAPFIGLFGTVWGIMNAFIEIAAQQSTNLAVVAPGIAEALLATGLGLLAAIPAVIFYNKLSNDCDRVIVSLEAFMDDFSTILSRQLGQ